MIPDWVMLSQAVALWACCVWFGWLRIERRGRSKGKRARHNYIVGLGGVVGASFNLAYYALLTFGMISVDDAHFRAMLVRPGLTMIFLSVIILLLNGNLQCWMLSAMDWLSGHVAIRCLQAWLEDMKAWLYPPNLSR